MNLYRYHFSILFVTYSMHDSQIIKIRFSFFLRLQFLINSDESLSIINSIIELFFFFTKSLYPFLLGFRLLLDFHQYTSPETNIIWVYSFIISPTYSPFFTCHKKKFRQHLGSFCINIKLAYQVPVRLASIDKSRIKRTRHHVIEFKEFVQLFQSQLITIAT